jgi:RimJ/RimL family protein N-acetyltransferase
VNVRALIDAGALVGLHVVLEPLDFSHVHGLKQAVSDGDVWKLWYTAVPAPDGMEAEIARRLALRDAGSMVPFTVFDRATGIVAGMTTYMNLDPERERLEIGSTWYAQRFRRTALNTEAKLLLLTRAFEDAQCIAVEFRTSAANLQSRRAIEQLGAKLDGVLRSHGRHLDGSLRDTHVYSIIAAEWPAVKMKLNEFLRIPARS